MTDWILFFGVALVVGFSFAATGLQPRHTLFLSHGSPWRVDPWSARPLPKEPPSKLSLGQHVPLESPWFLS
ncbi:MAG: hypothetical protein ACXVY8_04365 [Gaiellaceae bacterium]